MTPQQASEPSTNRESSNQEALLSTASKVGNVFAAEATAGETLRRLSPPAWDAIIESEFFTSLVPARFGGRELDFDVIPHMVREMAKGDVASAWVAAFLNHHNWQFGLFDLETQAEVWADRNYALAPATLAPTGKATKVKGGWELSGRWQWGTGVMHSEWALLTAVSDGSSPELLLVLLPLSDVEVFDVWHTDGMRATGSNDMLVANAFVPDRRAVTHRQISKREAPGQLANDNPLYRLDMLNLLSVDATATAVGGGERMVELFQEVLEGRTLMFGGKQREASASQIRLARAASIMRSARLMFDVLVEDLCAPLHGGSFHDPATRVRMRMDCAHIVDLVKQVGNLAADGAGASSHFLDAPLQRFRRDIGTLSGHVLFDYDRAGELHGQMMLGVKPPAGTLI